MIRITQTGVVIKPGAEQQLANEMTETGCAMLPGFLAPQILDPLLRQLESGRFEATDEVLSASGKVFGTTLKMPPTEPVVMTLHFILNTQTLFTAVEAISDCEGL